MSCSHKLLKVGHGAKNGINVAIVTDVIPKVFHGGLVERTQPHNIDSQLGNIRQTTYDTCMENMQDIIVTGSYNI